MGGRGGEGEGKQKQQQTQREQSGTRAHKSADNTNNETNDSKTAEKHAPRKQRCQRLAKRTENKKTA